MKNRNFVGKGKINIVVALALCLLCILSACGNPTADINNNEKDSNISSEDEGIRLAVYWTMYDGTKLKDYPNQILTDSKVLDIIDNASGIGEIMPNEGIVQRRIEYLNDSGQTVSILIMDSGKVSTMVAGLKSGETYLTDEEMGELFGYLT